MDASLASRRRVLIVTPAVPPPVGGLERMAVEMHRYLLDIVDAHLVGSSWAPRADPHATIVRGDTSSVPARIKTSVRIAAAVVLQLRVPADVVHAMTWRVAIPIAVMPRKMRPPLVLHCLGAEVLRVGPIGRKLRNLVFRRADSVLAISRYTATVVEGFSSRKPRLIPPGIPPERLAEAPTRGTHSPHSYSVVSVGSLTPRKGHAELVSAVAEAQRLGVPCSLTIVGRGPEEAALRDAINRLGVGSSVHIETDADDERVSELLTQADVFALLTRNAARDFEGFGIVFLEAAAAGLPIVCGDSPGALDAVSEGHNAIVVRSTTEATQAIRDLFADPALRTRLAREGMHFAAEFAWPKIIQGLMDVYDSVTETACSQ